MVCPKCGAALEQGAAFCTACGERTEEVFAPKGVKMRKQYKSSVYILLDFLAYGFLLGTNDFYAGFYKMGLFRLICSVVGFTLGLMTSNLYFVILPGVSALIGFLEVYGAVGKEYMLKDGRKIFLNAVDVIYDPIGTDNYLKMQFGCGLVVKERKEYSTSVFLILYFLLGGFAFGTNDFYAGYTRVGIFRVVSMFLAIIMEAAKLPAMTYVFVGITLLVGVAELFFLNPKKYVLENGNLAMIRPLDIIYDRKGTEEAVRREYGCGLPNGQKFVFGKKN